MFGSIMPIISAGYTGGTTHSLRAYRGTDMNSELILNAKKPSGDVNCTPFVRQYDILSKKWGVLLCQKEYQTNDIRRSSREWL